MVRVYQVKPSDYDHSLGNSTKKNKAVYDKEIQCPIKDPTVPYNFALDLRDYLQHSKKFLLSLQNLFLLTNPTEDSNLGQLLISVEPEKKQYLKLNKGFFHSFVFFNFYS